MAYRQPDVMNLPIRAERICKALNRHARTDTSHVQIIWKYKCTTSCLKGTSYGSSCIRGLSEFKNLEQERRQGRVAYEGVE
jgi:hypothetical protein